MSVCDQVSFEAMRWPPSGSATRDRVKKAPPGSAVFETVSEATFSGRVTDKASGKGVTATSGVIAYADADGAPAAITFGVRDLKVRRVRGTGRGRVRVMVRIS